MSWFLILITNFISLHVPAYDEQRFRQFQILVGFVFTAEVTIASRDWAPKRFPLILKLSKLANPNLGLASKVTMVPS